MDKNIKKKKTTKIRKFLPIGTVVLLKNAKKRVMITGFCASKVNDKDDKKMYDYCGVVYPEGVIKLTEVCLFDHKQIAKVFHMGLYKDEEEKAFKKKLIKLLSEDKQNNI